jgi:predicted HicB family RNase H-like nuclease
MPAPVAEHQAERADSEIKFTLRLAKAVMDQIDTAIRTRPGKVSRNQWIVEAIAERLHQQAE